MTNKKICGLSLPEEVNEYIRQRAEHEHRSLANVVAMMAINYYNLKNWDGVSPLSDKVLENVPSAQPEQRWIPFKTRPLTKEEKEEHPECDGILDCKLPDDGQRILVSVSVRGHKSIQFDKFYTDDGSYLDSGYEIGTEVTAWMPLPEPYMGTRSDTSDRRKD